MTNYTENFDVKKITHEVIEYLRKNSRLNIRKLEKKIENTEFCFTSENVFRFDLGDRIKVMNINPNSGSVCMDPGYNGKIYFPKCKCIISKNVYSKEKQKQIFFHELMHVLSIQRTKFFNNAILKCGITKTIAKYNKEKSFEYLSNDLLLLNESLTEIVSKYLYDKLYDEEYIIVEKNNEKKIMSKYTRSYFYIVYLLLDYFEKNPDKLFEIYFNNNIKLFFKVLKEQTSVNKIDLLNIIEEYAYCNNKSQEMINNFKFRKIIPMQITNNEDVQKQYNLFLESNLK